MIRYTLADFNNILDTCIINPLPDETIQIINLLAKQVGSPEYIKTPQFKNQLENNATINRRKKKSYELIDNDWDTIRTFQTTEFEKKEGVDHNIHLIRKYLNIITLNTYDKSKENIIIEINNVMSTNKNEDLICVINEIFKIITANIIFSDIYAKLYRDLINEFPIFYTILNEKFEKFEDIFNTIEYYDPEKYYDKFCENNKQNEIRRGICSFYVNLMKEGIIEKNIIGNIILNVFKTLNSNIISQNKKNEIDELSELIYIMITNSYEVLSVSEPDIFKEIYDNVIRITTIKNKEEPGITNKCIFKHMDILDEIS